MFHPQIFIRLKQVIFGDSLNTFNKHVKILSETQNFNLNINFNKH